MDDGGAVREGPDQPMQDPAEPVVAGDGDEAMGVNGSDVRG